MSVHDMLFLLKGEQISLDHFNLPTCEYVRATFTEYSYDR